MHKYSRVKTSTGHSCLDKTHKSSEFKHIYVLSLSPAIALDARPIPQEGGIRYGLLANVQQEPQIQAHIGAFRIKLPDQIAAVAFYPQRLGILYLIKDSVYDPRRRRGLPQGARACSNRCSKLLSLLRWQLWELQSFRVLHRSGNCSFANNLRKSTGNL